MFQALGVHRAMDLLQRGLYPALFAACAAAVLPFLLLAHYAHPSADDYCYAAAFREPGIWDHIKGEYLGWKGRYTAIVFTVLFHRIGGILVTYEYALLALLAALLVALHLLTRSVLEDALPAGRTLFYSLGLAALYLGTMPKAPATLYWIDGAMQYQLGAIFVLLALAALLRLHRAGGAAAAASACLFIFLAVGCTELAMMTLVAVVGVMAFARLYLYPRDRGLWTAVIVVTALSTALLLLAPGNAARAEMAGEQARDFGLAFSHAFFYGGRVLGDWIASPGLWLATAAFVPAALRLVYLAGIRRDADWRRAAVAAGLVLGLTWSFFFVLWWAAANNPPGRALNLIYLLFLAGWFITVLETVAVTARRCDLVFTPTVFPAPLRAASLGVTALLGVFLLAQGDARTAYVDLVHRAPAYDRAMNNRYAAIAARKEAEGHPAMALPPIEDPPRILMYSDIQPERGNWRNSCFARYFGLDSVVRRQAAQP